MKFEVKSVEIFSLILQLIFHPKVSVDLTIFGVQVLCRKMNGNEELIRMFLASDGFQLLIIYIDTFIPEHIELKKIEQEEHEEKEAKKSVTLDISQFSKQGTMGMGKIRFGSHKRAQSESNEFEKFVAEQEMIPLIYRDS